MKKADKKRLDESLSKALSPKRQKRDLDSILEEYETGVPKGIPEVIPHTIPHTIPTSIPEGIPSQPKPKAEQFTYLDATHTASEKSVYSVMYRETVSKGIAERHFGPAELMKKTGLRSRNTVHKALYGLQEKLSVEVVSEANGNPAGPRYRVYGWREIEERRKAPGITIDPQTKRIVARGIPEGIPTTIPPAIAKDWDSGIPADGIPGIPNIGTVINKEEVLSSQRAGDDEAFAELRAAAKEITGKEAIDWQELDEVLTTELKIAAGRTTVSSVPAFLAEHLRRRLWKTDKARLDTSGGPTEAQGRASGDGAGHKIDASQCPDCFGTNMRYVNPQTFEGGVVRCKHENLPPHSSSSSSEK
jgi:hypothetical protein